MPHPELRADESIVALVADVDGTLVDKQKVLTPRAIDAVRKLHERGVFFCLTSSRPPRGLRMFVQPLRLTIAMAGFNGGVIARLPDMSIVDEKPLASGVPERVIAALREHKLDVWVFNATDWYVTDPKGMRVERESSNIRFSPVAVRDFDYVLENVIKITGVSSDHEAVARCEARLQAELGGSVMALRSQPYYLDVTHPEANKGAVVDRLSRFLRVTPSRIATIGDAHVDVAMFHRSGLSVAMGDASPEVRRQATFVTTACGDEGFANAVERFILPRAPIAYEAAA